ncbi:Calx-beta domain-containing protein [Nocardioides stalactiti]|uniref:Calx-beta domain-containing protein n=1 Tax=Nocardioides stalactiti TaxID=2755356 RepID=UPI0015FFFC74|nr:Calx-beta domain-containing protein [Nocardioides stalactiti]
MRQPRLLHSSLVALAVSSALLTAPAQATPGPATPDRATPAARATLPSVAIGDAAVAEGSSGVRTARFTLTLSTTSASEVTVKVATADSTATVGSDYNALSTTVRFPAGTQTAVANVGVRGDTIDEATETFRVRLSAPTGASLGRSAGVGKVVDDDPPLTGLRVAAGDGSIAEGRTGARNVVVPVTLSGPAPTALTVDWTTIPGTATDGVDYSSRSGRLSFASGATTAYALVPILGDTQHEPNETLTVRIATPTGGAKVGRPNGTITITNDDPVPPVSPVGRLSAGVLHTCAVVAGGAVKCWGFNDDGQLGNGTYGTAFAPTTVTGLTSAVKVAAGHGHTCALLADTTVKCWGLNTDLQLGLGVDTQLDRNQDRLTPVTVPGLTGVIAIEAGSHHTCAILTGGTVKCWGEGFGGRQGNGGDSDVASPTTVAGWAGAVQMSAGLHHTCGRWADGTVKCSGSNFNGELGDGTQVNRTTPVAASGISGATALGTGQYHTCVVVAAVPRCWGYNFEGALGDGTQQTRYSSVPMTGVTTASAVSLGQDHTCVVLTSGSARCVGFNGSDARLGDGTTNDSFTSVPVSNLSGASVIESGVFHTCAVVTGGAVRCWGSNAAGQLGNGTGAGTLTPVTVTGVTVG